MVNTSGNDVRHRLLQCLTLSRAEPFGCHSLHHAAAANYMSKQSDIMVTKRTT